MCLYGNDKSSVRTSQETEDNGQLSGQTQVPTVSMSSL